MTISDRRFSNRYRLKVPLVFCATSSLLAKGHLEKSTNISLRGVYFMTGEPVSVGLSVQVLLRMPKRLSGKQAIHRVFTGRVSHIESQDSQNGILGVGVEFFYWEIPLEVNLTR